jgi:hypothetical protein
MGQWLVNQQDRQFGVDGLEDLRKMASESELWPGDMIQPEGAGDWIYAVEIPELQDVLKSPEEDDDFEFRRSGNGLRYGLAGLFLVVAVLGFGSMTLFYTQLPTGEEKLLGEGGTLAYTEMLMTTAAPLRAEATANGAQIAALQKDQVLELLAKREDFYKARTGDGKEGWVSIHEVVALYQFGGKEIQSKFDPLYNPDQYVRLENASWMMIERVDNNVTSFSFMLKNDSRYAMTDLVLEAVIKDSKGTVVGTKEFRISGILNPESSSFVGTLNPTDDALKVAKRAGEEPPPVQLLTETTFEEMAKEDQELALRWEAAVNVDLEEDFDEAVIRIIELRALPTEE